MNGSLHRKGEGLGRIPAVYIITVVADSYDSVPPTQLEIRFSMFSIHIEIPFQSGVPQDMLFMMEDAHATRKGVLDIPLLSCKLVTCQGLYLIPNYGMKSIFRQFMVRSSVQESCTFQSSTGFSMILV